MKTVKEKAEIMLAWAASQKVEYKLNGDPDDKWERVSSPSWNWERSDYRVMEEKVTMWAWYDGKHLGWENKGVVRSSPWKRVPSEDKTFKVET